VRELARQDALPRPGQDRDRVDHRRR
jgi:hypothetical protein